MIAAEPVLHFDEARHVYSVDGREIPSVTQVLDSNGMYGWLDRVHYTRLERAKQRGSAVHKAIELYARGELDWSSVSSEIAGYVEGYARWAAVRKWQAVEIEQRFYHPRYRYAGALDQEGLLGGHDPAVVDFKSALVFGPQAVAAARLQLSAYCHHADKPLLRKRVVLHLPGSGKYREHVFPMMHAAHDFQLFLAALAIHNFKAQEKLA